MSKKRTGRQRLSKNLRFSDIYSLISPTVEVTFLSVNLDDLLKEAQEGDMVAFAKLLTLIERQESAVYENPKFLNPEKLAFRIGITGPPGAGKSTLISELLKTLTSQNLKLGVIAVDPTSPNSTGAILGDRIRFATAENVNQVFIRSIGTRGSLGGLSAAVYLMLRAFDACGFDLVLIETVGVGQVEVEVMNVADMTCLVVVPESGDSIQVMKSGIMEVADLFIVNKSDRPGADSIKREIENGLLFDSEENKKVLLISALSGEGVDQLVNEINKSQKSTDWQKRPLNIKKLQAEALALFKSKIEKHIQHSVVGVNSIGDFKKLVAKEIKVTYE